MSATSPSSPAPGRCCARWPTAAFASRSSPPITQANARRQLGDANAALFSDFACGASLFGKAAKFRHVLGRAGVQAQHAIAIGDEVRDIEAARAAGIACAAVTWGYAAPEALSAHQPDMVFDRMEEIPARLIAKA